MNQQVTTVEVKEFHLNFNWILQDLWSYRWEEGQFMLSEPVQLQDVNVKSPIKYYPKDDRFEFLYFDHSAEGCKYGNAQVEIFLGDFQFEKKERKNFELRLCSMDTDRFFNPEDGCYKFPFSISYNVGCYQKKEAHNDEDEEFYEEANENYSELEENDDDDGEENADQQEENYNDGDDWSEENYNDDEPEEDYNDDEGENDDVEGLADDEGFEVIDGNNSPHMKSPRYLDVTSDTTTITENQDEFEFFETGSQQDVSTSQPEPEAEIQEEKFLDPEDRKVIQKLLNIQPKFADIIIDHFEDLSEDEKFPVIREIVFGLKLENFYEVLACADFWNFDNLLSIVVNFMASSDTKTVINSPGFKKLQSNALLYGRVKNSLGEAFKNQEINSPIIFFL